MKVLVICATYGRLPFLGRVLASFLSQDYKDKELLFINDDKNVTLTCNIENVHCININTKLTLGAKRNIGVAFDDYDLYMCYDDDDIFLPNRITHHVDIHYTNPDIYFYWNKSAYTTYDNEFKIGICSPTASSFKKEGWKEIGGYSNITKGEDIDFFNRINRKKVINDVSLIDYVYNWSDINYHATYSSEEDIIKCASESNSKVVMNNNVFEIVPDCDQFCKFITMLDKFKQTNNPVLIRDYKISFNNVLDNHKN